MSLIKIHKDSVKGGEPGFGDSIKGLLNFHKSEHFAKLRQEKKQSGFSVLEKQKAKEPEKPRKEAPDTSPKYVKLWHEPRNARKDVMLIAIIAVIALVLIVVELTVLGGNAGTKPAEDNNENDTFIPPVITNDTVGQPDLDVKSFSISKSEIEVNDTAEIVVSVKNLGDANVTNVSVQILLGSASIASGVIGFIAPGETKDFTVNFTAAAAQKGSQTLKVILDPDHIIDESSELNNEESKTISIIDKVIQDITANFKLQSTSDFTKRWYSEKFRLPPVSGEEYKYFQLSTHSTSSYYLDVSVPGFLASTIGKVSGIEIPDASDSGWNSHWCMKETMSDDTCIWNGPEIAFSFEFKNSRLTAEDAVGAKSTVTSSGKKIKDVKLVSMKRADWPGNLTTWRAYNAPEPNYFVPKQFYEYYGNKLYIHPMLWNPRTLEAQVTTWMRFEVTTA